MLRAGFAVLVLFVALLAGAPALGQPQSWDKAQVLAPGTKVELALADGKAMSGTLSALSPDGLILDRKGGATQIARSDIQRIWTLGKGSRLKNAGIGALIGFAVGCPISAAAAGTISDMNHPGFGTRAGVCVAIDGLFGGVASGIGAAVPATRRTLVYRSPAAAR